MRTPVGAIAPTLVSAIALALVSAIALVPVSARQQLTVLPVQHSVYLIAGAGANITVQIGNAGVTLVDTPPAALVPQVRAEIRKLSDKPIRFIVNTSADADHVGGNAALVVAPGARGGGVPFAFVGLGRPSIIAHEAVLNRMSKPGPGEPALPAGSIPTTEYFQPTMDFHNGEAIILYHQSAAHSDGDSVVLFRGSDVISAGDVFTPDRFPVIELAKGGSVQGLIKGLTNILALAVPAAFEEGGTKIIPGHGRVCEETDVAEYRDMIVIIRDRVQDLINKKMTLEQIKAAKPSRDYDREYGASAADADRWVETIYRSLTQKAGGRS